MQTCDIQRDCFFNFSEYLFLLTILIKPQSGFKIAFAMLDQDGSQTIDKAEFKVNETNFKVDLNDMQFFL